MHVSMKGKGRTAPFPALLFLLRVPFSIELFPDTTAPADSQIITASGGKRSAFAG